MLARSGSVLCFLLLAANAADNNSKPDNAKQATFSKDVAPIFQKSCQSCHHPGTSAPRPLMTYAEARPWARSIKERVALRERPPGPLSKRLGIRKDKSDLA